MPHDICSKFEKKYGRIKDLLLICLETSVLSALAQFWNSNLRCFELPSLDMVPAIKEYDVMLGLPIKEKAKVYLYRGSYVAKRKAADLIGLSGKIKKLKDERDNVEVRLAEKARRGKEKEGGSTSAEIKEMQTEEGTHAEIKVPKESQEKEFIIENPQHDKAEAEHWRKLAEDYSDALMKKDQQEKELEDQIKVLKRKQSQLISEVKKLKEEKESIEGWKLIAKHHQDKKNELVKVCEDMADYVQTHATNLSARVYEVEEEMKFNPRMKLPFKTFKLVKYCQDLVNNFMRSDNGCVQWPPYGLPPNYTPPIAVEPSDNNPRAETVNQQNPGPPLESNQAAREVSQTQPTAPLLMPYHFPPNYIPPQNNNPKTNQALGPQNTTSQQTIFINSQGESHRPHTTLASKEIHQSQNLAIEDSQSKEKLQILEERLRLEVAVRRKPLPGIGKKKEGETHAVMFEQGISSHEKPNYTPTHYQQTLHTPYMSECYWGVFWHYLIKKISNVKTPMKVIFEELCKFGGIKGLAETERSNDKEMKCGIHRSVKHSIEECYEFKRILQGMMDAHLIQISRGGEGREVDMVEESAVPRKQECTGVETVVSTLPTDEQTISMPKPLDIHYVKEALETAFQTFEVVNASYVRERAQIVRPRMSDASIMVARVMLKRGYKPGQGLGKCLSGVTKMPSSMEKKDRCGLGYQPTKVDKKRFADEKKEKRMARLENREPKIERIPICHIL
ncbi:G-patch domain [Sesbania bispinosa]|nr:G-patch domain [Sesbania bispinosa]